MTDGGGSSGHKAAAHGSRAGESERAPLWGNDIPIELARLTVPAPYRRSLNHCKLPAEALGSLAFQLSPQALEVDGVLPAHRALFGLLDEEDGADERARLFQAYMAGHFLLADSAAQCLSDTAPFERGRLDYLRLLHGWLLDTDGREAAVLKGWVESRFGLLTLFHRRRLGPCESDSRVAFEHDVAEGVYGAGALEAQLDLLYTWCQYELARRHPGASHLPLYHGFRADTADQLDTLPNGMPVILPNNLSTFSASREHAEEHGDRIYVCEMPMAKVLAFSGLFSGRLQGEHEYVVIGGALAVTRLA